MNNRVKSTDYSSVKRSKILMERIFPEEKVNYILRIYLPKWNREKILADMIRFCKETGTEHVLLFTDAQPMVWNQLTIEEAKKEAENISYAITELKKHGIHTGINSSYNQIPSKFDHSQHNSQYKYWTTLADGSSEKRVPCLLDPELKKYLMEFYRILAETGAEYIYIDDDHRYVFSGNGNTWGCMCDLHIAEFSEISGIQWSRETLQTAIFEDLEIRKQWISFLKKGLNDIAKVIEEAVHKVNPAIKIGVMVPCLHTTVLYDYDLEETARLFQPEGPLLLRPCIGPYDDRDRKQIIPGLFYMEMIRNIMKTGPEYTPEIETSPFSRFNKSMETVRFHIAQGIVNGMSSPALSAGGYLGNSPYFEPEFTKMLKREKPFFEALHKIAPKYGTKKGIGLNFSAKSALNTTRTVKKISDYYLPSFSTHDFLASSGFCITYDKSGTMFLAGDSVYSFSETELMEYLKGNLILDADAAKGFAERGLLEFTGAEIGEMDVPFGAEYFSNPDFCGKYTGTYNPLLSIPLDDIKKITGTLPGTKVLSTITDHNLKEVCPAVTLFENRLGGKVAVMNYRVGPATAWLDHLINYQKQLQLRNILNAMDPMSVPVFVEDPTCFTVQYFDDGNTVFTGIVNTSFDAAQEITVTFADPELNVEKGSYLAEDGTFKPLSDIVKKINDRQWKITHKFPVFHFFAITISK